MCQTHPRSTNRLLTNSLDTQSPTFVRHILVVPTGYLPMVLTHSLPICVRHILVVPRWTLGDALHTPEALQRHVSLLTSCAPRGVETFFTVRYQPFAG